MLGTFALSIVMISERCTRAPTAAVCNDAHCTRTQLLYALDDQRPIVPRRRYNIIMPITDR